MTSELRVGSVFGPRPNRCKASLIKINLGGGQPVNYSGSSRDTYSGMK